MYYNCEKCKNKDTEICEECSVPKHDILGGCSCHINPPCSFCIDLKYIEIDDEEDAHDINNER